MSRTCGDAPQPGLGVAHLGDLLGVARMIGRGVQDSARAQPVGDQGDGGRLKQPALVVPGLGPRVGEEHPHPGQRSEPNMCSSTSSPSPRTSRMLVTCSRSIARKQLGEAAPVNLDGNHVDVRFGLGHRQRRRAGAGADLQYDGRAATEPRGGVQRRGGSGRTSGPARRGRGQSRSQVCCWPSLRVDRRDRKLVTRGYRCESESSAASAGAGALPRARSADSAPHCARIPPSSRMSSAYARIVVQIDTQQLPIGLSTGGGIRVAGRAGADATMTTT